jgi:hypothetical protein
MSAANLLEWLAVTPFRVALVVIAIPALLATSAGLLLVRWVFADDIAGASGMAGSKAGYMAETYAVLLGLMLAASFAGYQGMQETVLGEGQSLKAIMHVAPQLPAPQRAAVEAAVQDYARLVVENEWPRLALGDADEAAERAFERLFEAGTAVASEVGFGAAGFFAASQIQGLLQEVLRRRTERLAAGPGRPLADLLSEILVGLALVAVAIPWFLESRSLILHLLLSGMLVITYITLITLSVELLYPFAGQIALDPEPIRAVLPADPAGGSGQ